MQARRAVGVPPFLPERLAMAVQYLACMLATAQFYHLPPRVLPSIQAVEGGYVGAQHANTDGTVDLGVMQINTRWLRPLSVAVGKITHSPMPPATVYRRLIADPCFNIAAAGLILQAEYVWAGHDWQAAVGNYHSHTAQLHTAYLVQVMAKARTLFGGDG